MKPAAFLYLNDVVPGSLRAPELTAEPLALVQVLQNALDHFLGIAEQHQRIVAEE